MNPNADFYSTDLPNKSYFFNKTIILQSFPVFQKNLHCVQKWSKIMCGNILKSYPLAKWQSMEISVLFHSFAHLTLPFWIEHKFLKTSPVFQENLHCVEKWPKIKCGKILKSYPLAKWQSVEISVLFHSFAHLTLPLWIKRIPENFSSFPGKFTLYTKKDKNYIQQDFKVLPSG